MNSNPPSPRLRATRGVAALSLGALVLAGCGSDPAADPATGGGTADPISVLATTTIWGDIAGQVVKCAGTGEVSTLMPVGADPHDFSPSAQDVAAMVGADLVVANGLGLEGGLASSLASAAQDGATVFEVAPLLDPIPFGAHEAAEHADDDHAADDGHDHDGDDPHVWHDVARAATAAELIGAKLTELTGDPAFGTCGESLHDELDELDAVVAASLAEVPADRRILVTDHDALGYLAEAYDYTVAGTVIPGGSTLAEPSSAELASLADAIRDSGVPAIFSNTADSQVLVDALAAEVGDVEVVSLFVGSLGGPGSGAEDYQGMVTTNAQSISAALRG